VPLTKADTRAKRQAVERTSPDIAADRLAKVGRLFPEVFTEGKTDFDKLRATLAKTLPPALSGSPSPGRARPGPSPCSNLWREWGIDCGGIP
jgi:hypothetical protein